MEPNEHTRIDHETEGYPSQDGQLRQQNNWQTGAQGSSNGWQPPTPKERSAKGLALAAMILGIVSILCSCTVYPAFICGGLAIILALLSRRKGVKMPGTAKAGIITGFLGLFLGIYLMVNSVYTLMTDPQAHQMLNDMSQQIYGQTFDEMIEEIYGSESYRELFPESFPDSLE